MRSPQRQQVLGALQRAAAGEMEEFPVVADHGHVAPVRRGEAEIVGAHAVGGKHRLGLAGLGQHPVDPLQPAEVASRETLLIGHQPVAGRRSEPAGEDTLDVDHDPGPLRAEQPRHKAAPAPLGEVDAAAGGADRLGQDCGVAGQSIVVGASDEQPVEQARGPFVQAPVRLTESPRPIAK